MTHPNEEEAVRAMLAPLKQVRLQPQAELTGRVEELAPLAVPRPDAPASRTRASSVLTDLVNMLSGLFLGGSPPRAQQPENP